MSFARYTSVHDKCTVKTFKTIFLVSSPLEPLYYNINALELCVPFFFYFMYVVWNQNILYINLCVGVRCSTIDPKSYVINRTKLYIYGRAKLDKLPKNRLKGPLRYEWLIYPNIFFNWQWKHKLNILFSYWRNYWMR